jgi:hypothetical protein
MPFTAVEQTLDNMRLFMSRFRHNCKPREWDELTQIKRHRRGKNERRQNGSLTHGKKTPEIKGNEDESRA